MTITQSSLDLEGWSAAERGWPGCSAEWDVLGAPFVPRLRVNMGVLWACGEKCRAGTSAFAIHHVTCLAWRGAWVSDYEPWRVDACSVAGCGRAHDHKGEHRCEGCGHEIREGALPCADDCAILADRPR